jgi:hypothetical protein
MERKNKINLAVVFVVVSFIVFMLSYRGGERKFVESISSDSLTAMGKVTNVERPYKHGIAVSYFFEVEGFRYNSEVESSRYAPVENSLIGRNFPVVYKKSNPRVNYILIVEDDYRMFGRRITPEPF